MTSGGCGITPGCARTWSKISSVASTLDTQSVRAVLEALIAGQRNPGAIADLAIGKMRAKRKELAEALDGKFARWSGCSLSNEGPVTGHLRSGRAFGVCARLCRHRQPTVREIREVAFEQPVDALPV
jgi:hypothetical protein